MSGMGYAWVVAEDLIAVQYLGKLAVKTLLVLGEVGRAGRIEVRDGRSTTLGRRTIPVNSLTFRGKTARLDIGVKGNAGDIRVDDEQGRNAFHVSGKTARLDIGAKGNYGKFNIYDENQKTAFHIRGDDRWMEVRDENGNVRFLLDGRYDRTHIHVGNEAGVKGQVRIYDGTKSRILLDGHTGDIKLSGADCAEEFDVVESEKIDHGTVLVIDDDKLQPCDKPYDKKVAGVVSGGNDSNPGIILGNSSTQEKRLPIALNGKVYCKVDARFSPIEVGDLLTTSHTVGHAMKANDPSKAFGAVIGKALQPLRKGKGLIPILVALQ